MYKITADAGNNLLDVQLSGMLTTDEVVGYIAELKRLFVSNGLAAPYKMIIDVTACPIQSQDVIKIMGQHMATMPKASAIGVVTGSSLAKMQIRRLFTQPYARITSTYSAARLWVLTGNEP